MKLVKFTFLFITGILSFYTVCKGQSGLETELNMVKVWWSSELKPESKIWYTNPPSPDEINYKVAQQEDVYWNAGNQTEGLVFNINPSNTFQSILGLGLSLEETSIYAMRKNKTEEEMRAFVSMLLDPDEGMGMSLFRITIGTSDFSDARVVSDHPQGYYSYQDDKNIPFSIKNDIELNIISTLKMVIEEAEKLNLPHNIKFFASVWSPPAWMKTSESLIGGTLKDGYEDDLALYFRKFIEAYEAEGIPIHAITIQNEPNFTPKTYPGMRLTPKQESIIAKAIHKEFECIDEPSKNIKTEVWINDHNMNHWKNANNVLKSLDKEGEKEIVDAVAFHNYNPAASITNMSKLHELHPKIDIHLTEHSEWGVKGMHDIQQYFINWSKSYSYWVSYTTKDLGEHNQGPYNKLNSLSPTLFIEKEDDSPEYYVTPEYYLITQFSRYIRPGARRIECTVGVEKNLTSVAFRNEDGSFVQVLVNQTNHIQRFITNLNGRFFKHYIPAKTVGTYVF